MHGTHDERLWRSLLRTHKKRLAEDKDPKSIHACLCGFVTRSLPDRDAHINETLDDKQHGIFFDELPAGGGSFVLMDLNTNEIVKTGWMRVPSTSTTLLHSTSAETETARRAILRSIIDKNIPPGKSIMISTDSQAFEKTFHSLITGSPTVSQSLKSNSGHEAETFRTIIKLGKAQGSDIGLQWTHHERTRPIDDSGFQSLEVRMNFVNDFGADFGKKLKSCDADIPEDFGSSGDHRAHRPIIGSYYPIIFTFQGLTIHHITKQFISEIQSARNLILLSDPDSQSGTVTRHIRNGRIDPSLSSEFRAQATAAQEAATVRYSMMRWRASISEITRALSASETTSAAPEIITKCIDPNKAPCLFCDGDTEDSYEHARSGKCACQVTSLGLNYAHACMSEVLGQFGPCEEPRRWRPPCPKWSDKHNPTDVSLLTLMRNATRHSVKEEVNIGRAFEILASDSLDSAHRKRLQAFISKYDNGIVINRLAKSRGDGRNYANAGGVQNLPGMLRSEMCKHYFDIDCDTSHPSNLIDALRAFDMPVPDILYKFVTQKNHIRKVMAGYYFGKEDDKASRDKAKKLINALLYGQSTESKTFFEDAGIKQTKHHDDILAFAQMIGDLSVKITAKCPDDMKFAKDLHPTENEHKWRFTALSELLVRIEEQKLSCMISRLVDYWGVNPKSLISMHDGVMVSPHLIRPDGQLAARERESGTPPTIDQEVLKDICK